MDKKSSTASGVAFPHTVLPGLCPRQDTWIVPSQRPNIELIDDAIAEDMAKTIKIPSINGIAEPAMRQARREQGSILGLDGQPGTVSRHENKLHTASA